jgi:ABC-type polysaccharide/polyol phosphate transport system ATPase subunit
MSNEILSVKNLSKSYRLGTYNLTYLKQLIFEKHKIKTIQALNNVNLNLDQGETIAILGKNGSGKSTLCKIISRIIEPTSGNISYNGKLVSMLEIGIGIEKEANAIENILFLGGIYGYRKKDIKDKIDEILEFSDLYKFRNTPTKKYSFGMLTRLYFSTLTSFQPDILIADEVLAVSDDEFKKKGINRLLKLKENGTSIIFISHEKPYVKLLCNKAYYFEKPGVISQKVDIDTAFQHYENS